MDSVMLASSHARHVIRALRTANCVIPLIHFCIRKGALTLAQEVQLQRQQLTLMHPHRTVLMRLKTPKELSVSLANRVVMSATWMT